MRPSSGAGGICQKGNYNASKKNDINIKHVKIAIFILILIIITILNIAIWSPAISPSYKWLELSSGRRLEDTYLETPPNSTATGCAAPGMFSLFFSENGRVVP